METAVSSETTVLYRLTAKVRDLKLNNSDIARIADKSPATVSQVLNGKYKGRPEVVEEILVALEAAETEKTNRAPERV